MNTYTKAVASIANADMDGADYPHGGFTAVLSTPSKDRDGDRLERDEWIEPLPARLPLDIDHGMSVADTVGSFTPFFQDDVMMMRAWFADTPKAQEVRSLVRDGHIGAVSVAFLTDKDKKSAGDAYREILNAGIVACPSNRDAVILATKAVDALNDSFGGTLPGEVKEAVMKALRDEKSPKDDSDDDADDGDDEDEETRCMDDAETDSVKKAAKPPAEHNSKFPYGPPSKTTYADPGYRDGVHRYPVRNAEEVRAAWDYIHHSHDGSFYTPEQVQHIESVISSAAKEFGVTLSKSFEGAETKDAGYITPQYADPDNERYPIHTREHVQNAVSYIAMRKGEVKYSKKKLGQVLAGIHAAAGQHGIPVDGAPAAGSSAGSGPMPAGGNGGLAKSVVEVVAKAGARTSGADQAMLQAVHDASVHLGAYCEPMADPNSGAADGANKSLTVDDFSTALDETLGLKESSADLAADVAAADVKSAAAEEAAGEASEGSVFADMLSWSKTII